MLKLTTNWTEADLFVFKSVLPLFRCLTSIERNVKRCQVSVSSPSDRVVIQFFCRHGRKYSNSKRLPCCNLQNNHCNSMLLPRHCRLWPLGGGVLSIFIWLFLTGITKTYNLGFQESEPLQAVFASHLCANALKAPARFTLQDFI